MKSIRFLLLFLLGVTSLRAQIYFNLPLKGTPGKDFFIVNYVDHDTSKSLKDPFCGNKTYDGHMGTDFLLRSWPQADSGWAVYAAADGVVFETVDGKFDRNKHTNSGGFGNYIGINHNYTLYTYYAHLRKGSLKVKVGDAVKAGQLIGFVACSGNCTDPHLHFEVWDNASHLVDPFTGNCRKGTSLWIKQPAYDTSLKVLESGFVPYLPDLDTLRERYLVKDTFTSSDTIACYWALMQGLRQGDTSRVVWYSPSGRFWYSYSFTHSQDWWYAYIWTYINRPPAGMGGLWTAKYYVKNKLADTRQFYLSPLTGIETSGLPTDIRFYPNPTTGSIKFQNLPSEPLPYSIYSLTGQSIGRGILTSPELALNGLANGLYILRIRQKSLLLQLQR